MKRIADVRQVIANRLRELGRSESWLSLELKKNRGYINEFMGGSPRDLPYEIKLKVADLLSLKPQDLGISPIAPAAAPGGFGEDAEPYEPPRAHFLATTQHIAFFKMKTHALDQHEKRIKPGDILAVDLNRSRASEIPSGKVVVAQRYDKQDLTKSHGTIIRQFIAPNKLITNSSVANEIVSIDDPSLPYEIVIKGMMISVVSAEHEDHWRA